MADKTIGQLDSGQLTSPNDKLIFENANGETKYTTYGGLIPYIGEITSPGDMLLFRRSSDGMYSSVAYATLIQKIFGSTVNAGTGISITMTSDAQGVHPVIACTVTGGGSTWYFGDTAPASAESGDYWLHTDSANYGDVDSYDGSSWSNVGSFAGRDGTTPHIDSTSKHWFIGNTDTNILAEGQNGANGQDGAAATVTVGTVTTGAAGTNASVTNSGTSSAAVFDFVIPRGADGTGSSITVSNTLTLTSAGWSNNEQTVNIVLDTAKRNVVDITPSELASWAQYGVYAYSESTSGITFKCDSVPSGDLTFRVTSMEVSA